jgi:hypothetical protein
MLEVAGTVVCACFFVCWTSFVLANLFQIRSQRTNTLNYYLIRMNVVFAIGMFIDNVKTFALYLVVGDAFEVMYVFGSILQTLMAQVALGMLSFITYQALLAAHTFGEIVPNEKITSSLRKRFIAINVGSTVWSLVVSVITLTLNKAWPLGLLRIMWAVSALILEFYFWHSFLLLTRTAQKSAESLGVQSVKHSLRKPVLTTALISLILICSFVNGISDLLDMQSRHHGNSIESYVPVNEVLFLLACTASTFFAWLPFKNTVGPDVRKRRKRRISGTMSPNVWHLRSPSAVTVEPRELVTSPSAASAPREEIVADADSSNKIPFLGKSSASPSMEAT